MQHVPIYTGLNGETDGLIKTTRVSERLSFAAFFLTSDHAAGVFG